MEKGPSTGPFFVSLPVPFRSLSAPQSGPAIGDFLLPLAAVQTRSGLGENPALRP